MAKQPNLSSFEGRQQHMRGLAEAAKQIAAEERVKQVQLKLFENLKTEDVQKIQ